jgi:hypothetical protein
VPLDAATELRERRRQEHRSCIAFTFPERNWKRIGERRSPAKARESHLVNCAESRSPRD